MKKPIFFLFSFLLFLNILNAASYDTVANIEETHDDINEELKIQEEKIIDLNKLLLEEVLYQKELVFNKKIANQIEKE